MHNLRLDLFQTILALMIIVWGVGFLFSLLFKQTNPYMNWTGQTVRSIWRHSWQVIIGILAGYLLAGKPFLTLL